MEAQKLAEAQAFASEEKKFTKVTKFDAEQYYQHGGVDELQGIVEDFREIGCELDQKQLEHLEAIGFERPTFLVDTKAVRSMNALKRKRYNKKKAEFIKRRMEWGKTEQGKLWKDTIWDYKHEYKLNAARKLVDTVLGDHADEFPTIDATVEAMDEALMKNTALADKKLAKVVAGVDIEELQRRNETHRIWEDQIRQAEYYKFFLMTPQADTALGTYMQQTHFSNAMNEHLRGYENPHFGAMCSPMADTLKEGLSKVRLSRDVVVRRGCSLEWLARTMGVKGVQPATDSLTGEAFGRVRSEVERLLSGDTSQMVLEEKGFTSTAMGMNTGFAAKGVEVIILARKGTHGLNVSDRGPNQTEQELLLGAGTKFRIVKTYLNREGDAEKKEALLGGEGNIRIYLETIPDSTEAQ